MIKKRISSAAVLMLIFLGIFSSCKFIQNSATIKILLVEDEEISGLNSEGISNEQNSEYTRTGLLIYNTGYKRASFIPILFSSQFPDSFSLNSFTEWIDTNFSVKIDYSAMVPGNKVLDLYEVIDSLTVPNQIQIQSKSLSESKDLERWNTVIKNAELFLQDEVFSYISAAAGSSIPEKAIQNFISMYLEDAAEFYYMRTLVIDINSVTGYLYEHEYIQQTLGEYK